LKETFFQSSPHFQDGLFYQKLDDGTLSFNIEYNLMALAMMNESK